MRAGGQGLAALPDFPPIVNRKSKIENGFSLIEVLVVVSLLSLIVLALMAVFSSTQRAFRSAVTQTDVLEGSRETMDLITTDLRGLTPSDGVSNGAVNFFVVANYNYRTAYQPLVQSLPGGTATRANLLNYFFVPGPQQHHTGPALATSWTRPRPTRCIRSTGFMHRRTRLIRR